MDSVSRIILNGVVFTVLDGFEIDIDNFPLAHLQFVDDASFSRKGGVFC